MKKLRMTVTSVIVLSIVGSAFAFNAKKTNVFCVNNTTTDATPSQCDAVVTGKFINPSGTINYYYGCWSGIRSECTAAGNTHCPTSSQVKLSDD